MIIHGAVREAVEIMLDYGRPCKRKLAFGLCLAYTPPAEETPARFTISRKGEWPSKEEMAVIAELLCQTLPGRPRLRPKLEEVNGYGCAVYRWIVRQIHL